MERFRNGRRSIVQRSVQTSDIIPRGFHPLGRFHRGTFSITVATLLALSFIACENPYLSSDHAGTSSAAPTVAVAHQPLDDLTGQQVLERVSEQLKGLFPFEATYEIESVSPGETLNLRRTISLESWQRFRMLTERNDIENEFREEVFFDGRLYSRKAASFAELESTRWGESIRRPEEPERVVSVLEEIDESAALEVSEVDGSYLLVGSVLDPLRGAGGGVPITHERHFEGGRFEATIDPNTFVPTHITYDVVESFQAIVDEAETYARVTTFSIEFISANEEVKVSPPSLESLQPTPPPATPTPIVKKQLEDLTGEQLLDLVSEQMDSLKSFEATYISETHSPEGVESFRKTISLQSPDWFRVLTESRDGFTEEIYLRTVLYRRSAPTLAELRAMRWEENWYLPGAPDSLMSVFRNFEDPDAVKVDGADAHYLLIGDVVDPLRGASNPPRIIRAPDGELITYIRRFESGGFSAIIDGMTFAPISIAYSMTEVIEVEGDPTDRTEKFTTVRVEFISFNEEVTVTPPPHELINVLPTAGSSHVDSPAVTPTPTPTTVVKQ